MIYKNCFLPSVSQMFNSTNFAINTDDKEEAQKRIRIIWKKENKVNYKIQGNEMRNRTEGWNKK